MLIQVEDRSGRLSTTRFATLEVVTPGSPPSVLPSSLPSNTTPRYVIVPHRNGDATYSESNYSLSSARADVWQIMPQTGGNFAFTTTGNTDTVLGLYDAANGQLLAFDQDNGPGNNAQITFTLTADHRYFLAVVAENGSSGNYGLTVTGPNQTVTASLVPAAPLYKASMSESVSQPGELDYFEVVAPTGATQAIIRLANSSLLNGWVRIDNQNHETLATAFLAGTGTDDLLSSIKVQAGQTYYMNGTALSRKF